ncbi:MAG: hypothetical protein HYR56_31405 [Acidobacteria bacterium]|nr:hypothetical protein [Acidobacteriota bacterium]MBI3427541.1 hypothetical protein [Acidobacteriota bacterium]
MTTSLQTNSLVLPTVARRAFLRQGALACAAAGLVCQAETLAFGQNPAAGAQGKLANAKVEPAARMLTRSIFTPYLSDHFETVTESGEPVILLLLEINDLPPQARQFAAGGWPETEVARQREASFSLMFRGPADWPLRQRSYNVAHPKLGKLELFLVPVGKVEKDAVARLYEAVFNRMP